MNTKIDKIFKVLQFDIDDINLLYKDTLKDPFIEAGFEYSKKYPYNEETIKDIDRKTGEQNRLIMLNVEKLYGRIFNFTQTYYAMKECLSKTYTKKVNPQLFKIIDDFFCKDKIHGISRIDICNKLKHDPQNDLKYKLNFKKEKILTNKGMTYSITNLGKTWFYNNNIDSVKLSNILFFELKTLLEQYDLNYLKIIDLQLSVYNSAQSHNL